MLRKVSHKTKRQQFDCRIVIKMLLSTLPIPEDFTHLTNLYILFILFPAISSGGSMQLHPIISN